MPRPLSFSTSAVALLLLLSGAALFFLAQSILLQEQQQQQQQQQHSSSSDIWRSVSSVLDSRERGIIDLLRKEGDTLEEALLKNCRENIESQNMIFPLKILSKSQRIFKTFFNSSRAFVFQ